jgi:hypothetical protein
METAAARTTTTKQDKVTTRYIPLMQHQPRQTKLPRAKRSKQKIVTGSWFLMMMIFFLVEKGMQ